jgi:hypothetical protein
LKRRLGTKSGLQENVADIDWPYIRDEEILDSIKTHVLKNVARIGRFRRFTWRVRCERHRRFCRSS